MNYQIVHSKWIRGGTQNGEYCIDNATRKKEAYGLAKHHFKSALEVIEKHVVGWEDYEIDEENLSITLADTESTWYHSRFFVREIDEKVS